ncbi:MAG: ABC transporter permease [Actinomycetota bacterium]
MRRALDAEWTKLRSVRSTTWTTIAVVGVTVGLSAFLAAVGGTNSNEAGARGDDDVVVNGLRGVWLGQVGMVAFGAVALTSEFATGTIRATFAAFPRRSVALGAKAAVVAAVAFVVGSVASAVSFVIAQPLLHEGGFTPPAYPYVSLADPSALRAVLGTALFLTLLALFAMGVAAIVRHTAAAMTAAVGLVLVPTVLMEFFTGRIRELLQQAAPAAGLSIQITADKYDVPPLGPWGGLAVTAAWALAALLVGMWTLERRDV